jgi:hypothetical protein
MRLRTSAAQQAEGPTATRVRRFSVYDDETNEFEVTFVQCTNCGVVHKVIDLCASAVLRGRDEMNSVITVDDVKNSVPPTMAAVLELHKADLPTWQQVAWIVEEKRWGSYAVLTSEYIDGTRQGKVMTILGETLYKITNFTNETVAG